MVTDNLNVVADHVVCGSHGVLFAGLQNVFLVGVIAGERASLDAVTVVEDENFVGSTVSAYLLDD